MKSISIYSHKKLQELNRIDNPVKPRKSTLYRIGKMSLYIPALVLCLFLYSCEKSLNLAPQTNYSEATFFKTADQFKMFVNQFYLLLPQTGVKDQTRDSYSDLFASLTLNTVSNGSYFPTPSSDTWQNSYGIIRNSTYLIGKGDAASADLKSKAGVYIAEAKFFRALAYYNLFRDFGGVPIIDKVLDLNDVDLLFGPRNTRTEVFNYMMKDLDEAIADLPVQSAIAASDLGRVSQGAALALKARIALFEGTWQKFRNGAGYGAMLDLAIDASNKVMTSGEYALFDRRDVLGDESYRYFFILDKNKSNSAGLTKYDQKENIFVNRFDETIRPRTQYDYPDGPWPTKKAADLFLCKDGLPITQSPLFQGRLTVTSEYANRDLRMMNNLTLPNTHVWKSFPVYYLRDWSNPTAGGYINYPFSTDNGTITGYVACKFMTEINRPSADLPMIRYAEVLLINAEALFEKNGSITDAQLDLTINQLRARAGVASLSNAFVAANGLDMQTEIRRERTVELFKEGQRFDDVRRWKTAETEMPQALKGVLWTGTQYSTDPRYSGKIYPLDGSGNVVVEDASKRHFTEKNYLFPLPTHQILLNPKLEQNPGW